MVKWAILIPLFRFVIIKALLWYIWYTFREPAKVKKLSLSQFTTTMQVPADTVLSRANSDSTEEAAVHVSNF